MRRFVLVLCLLLLTAIALPAGEYSNGYVADGYTYKDPYWWYADTPYTREKVYYTYTYYTYSYGCSYPHQAQAYYYRYSKVPNYVTYADPDWRSKLLDIAAQRDKFEGKLRASANEHNQFLESVSALGLTGNFYWEKYGLAPGLAAPYRNYAAASVLAGNYGATGNTVYGYNYQTLIDAYGTTDINAALQQAAALARDGQTYGAQGVTQFNGVVNNLTDGQVRVAETLAKGVSASQTLQAAGVQGSVKAVTSQQTITTVPNAPQNYTTQQGSVGVTTQQQLGFNPTQNGLSRAQMAAAQNCMACHSGNAPKGGYNVLTHWQMDETMQAKVVDHLMLPETDPKFMPRGLDGKPGRRLPATVIQQFMPQRMQKVQ